MLIGIGLKGYFKRVLEIKASFGNSVKITHLQVLIAQNLLMFKANYKFNIYKPNKLGFVKRLFGCFIILSV